MDTIRKMRNYWIGMAIMPFILVAGAAVYENDLDKLFTDRYMFSETGIVFLSTTALAIMGTYIYHILKEGIKKDIQEIRKALEERRIAAK